MLVIIIFIVTYYINGLHLLYAGKELLAKNFVVSINNFFRQAHISPKNISGQDDSSLSMSFELSDVENFHN